MPYPSLVQVHARVAISRGHSGVHGGQRPSRGVGLARSLGIFLNGEGIASPDHRGERVVDDSFYVLFNAHHEPVPFRLPDRDWGRRWATVLDTVEGRVGDLGAVHEAGQPVPVEARSLLVLRRVR